MIYDTDKTPPEGNPSTPPNQPVPLVTTQMGFQHPAGFEPAAVLIIGMNKEGKTFINMPIEQPHLCLHLATITLQCASEMAVKTMHDALMKKSPIVPVPPGLTIPPWAEPA